MDGGIICRLNLKWQRQFPKKDKKGLGKMIFSLILRRFLFVAQLVEQLTLNQRVVSSSLTEETENFENKGFQR